MDLTVEIATEVPLVVGPRVTFEGPFRLQGSVMVGPYPRTYLDVTQDLAVAAGWYDEPTATLIGAALGDAWLFRTHLGWRPFPAHGLEVGLGWGLAALGGELTSAEVLEAAAEEEPPESAAGRSYDLAATAHQLDVEAGWRFLAARDRVVVRLSLGGSFTLGARIDATRQFDVRPATEGAWDRLEGEVEGDLEDTLTRYVHTPTVGIGLGWRFDLRAPER